MAIDCDPDALVNASRAFLDLPWKTRQAIRILNWCAFLNGTVMDCSPQALVAASSCYANCMSAAQMDAVESYLSCQIANGGGGGGGATQVFIGDYSGGEPNFTPTVTPAVAFDSSTTPPYDMWVWDGSAWG